MSKVWETLKEYKERTGNVITKANLCNLLPKLMKADCIVTNELEQKTSIIQVPKIITKYRDLDAIWEAYESVFHTGTDVGTKPVKAAPGFVYLLKCKEDYMKVGTAQDVAVRIGQLNKAHSVDWVLRAVLKFDTESRAHKFEQAMHTVLSVACTKPDSLDGLDGYTEIYDYYTWVEELFEGILQNEKS